MATIEDLKNTGYDVGVGFEGEDFTVYRVEGVGVSMQVRDDDKETIQSLVDSYDEMTKQQDESPAQTRLRWHEDPAVDFSLDPESEKALRQQV